MSCERFEREGLLALERGEQLDPHFESCPVCLAARARYQRLGLVLGTLAADTQPPVGWQVRVRQRLEERRHRRNTPRWWWFALPAAAAALVALVLVRPSPPPEPRLALAVEVLASGVVRRGTEAHPGDRLEISAQLAGAGFAELRIYRNDRGPLLTCSTAEPCRRAGESLAASFLLPSAGSYQVLLLASSRPLPVGSTGTLDGDAGRALGAGAKVELGPGIEVR